MSRRPLPSTASSALPATDPSTVDAPDDATATADADLAASTRTPDPHHAVVVENDGDDPRSVTLTVTRGDRCDVVRPTDHA